MLGGGRGAAQPSWTPVGPKAVPCQGAGAGGLLQVRPHRPPGSRAGREGGREGTGASCQRVVPAVPRQVGCGALAALISFGPVMRTRRSQCPGGGEARFLFPLPSPSLSALSPGAAVRPFGRGQAALLVSLPLGDASPPAERDSSPPGEFLWAK